MTDLAEWLLAQIADDEQLAQAYLARREAQGIDREKWAYRLVLADAAAKRKLIEGCVETLEHEDSHDYVLNGGTGEEYDLARFALSLLAAVYADRPGYLEEW